jgi:hypothetical protein
MSYYKDVVVNYIEPGEMSEFTNFRFELYATKRIEQKNRKLSSKQRGSPIKAVKEVIRSRGV